MNKPNETTRQTPVRLLRQARIDHGLEPTPPVFCHDYCAEGRLVELRATDHTRPKILSPFRRHQVAVLVVRVFPERVDKRVVGCGRLPRVVRVQRP